MNTCDVNINIYIVAKHTNASPITHPTSDATTDTENTPMRARLCTRRVTRRQARKTHQCERDYACDE